MIPCPPMLPPLNRKPKITLSPPHPSPTHPLNPSPSHPNPTSGRFWTWVTSLVDKSLVANEETPVGPRYRLLETVRQYAGERLAESGSVERLRKRHLEYGLRLALDTRARLSGSEQAEGLRILDMLKTTCGTRSTIRLRARRMRRPACGWRERSIVTGWSRGSLTEGRSRFAALPAHPGGQARTGAIVRPERGRGHGADAGRLCCGAPAGVRSGAGDRARAR